MHDRQVTDHMIQDKAHLYSDCFVLMAGPGWRIPSPCLLLNSYSAAAAC